MEEQEMEGDGWRRERSEGAEGEAVGEVLF